MRKAGGITGGKFDTWDEEGVGRMRGGEYFPLRKLHTMRAFRLRAFVHGKARCGGEQVCLFNDVQWKRDRAP